MCIRNHIYIYISIYVYIHIYICIYRHIYITALHTLQKKPLCTQKSPVRTLMRAWCAEKDKEKDSKTAQRVWDKGRERVQD